MKTAEDFNKKAKSIYSVMTSYTNPSEMNGISKEWMVSAIEGGLREFADQFTPKQEAGQNVIDSIAGLIIGASKSDPRGDEFVITREMIEHISKIIASTFGKQEDKWIDVKERLPENEWAVIVCIDGEPSKILHHYHHNMSGRLNGCWLPTDRGIIETRVTHWQPLPTAPPLTDNKECDHYFARKSDGGLMPCEFCGKIKTDNKEENEK